MVIDRWLMTLKPLPSPFLVCGKLSPAAKGGKALFHSAETGCATCHGSNLFTDRRSYDVGTAAATDQGGDLFDTPALSDTSKSRRPKSTPRSM
jgi:cytochrome c peroxidase